MAPRKRTPANRDFPVGLGCKKLRGKTRYYYRFPSGKQVMFPEDTPRHAAIEAASIYNGKHRNPVFELIDKHDQYNKPLKQWMPEVIKRVKNEESLGANAISTFEADCARLVEWFGNTMTKSIDLVTVNEYLAKYNEQRIADTGKALSNNVYNRKISFLRKVFDYLCDMSAMEENPAKRKKSKPKEKKIRTRLTMEEFQLIHAAAPHWLQTAMDLALQTTHAVLEISRIQYKDCEYFEQPNFQNGFAVLGMLRIHRQKVQDKEASRVAIPITPKLKAIIDNSRDNVVSPYVVHRNQRTSSNPISRDCTHWTQFTPRLLSEKFSEIRDELGIRAEMSKAARPTFHEIRALSIHLYTEAGYDPQARAAHTDSKSTKIYQRGHVDWVEVPAGEVG